MGNYFVSRQLYWPDGEAIVEVAIGGADYCNPDMLVPKFAGEGQEYETAIEAVEVAIGICQGWRDSGKKEAKIAVGNTGGFTLPFEPTTFADARKWARKRDNSLSRHRC